MKRSKTIVLTSLGGLSLLVGLRRSARRRSPAPSTGR